ncbi:MAG: indole-3-glycerol phosphate synthase TrpC [Deltaproteobacteria bacterium]|nr:indole-3-glycerol phosphate synthase TrpC [Deltaproteobacteria bacterium]
MTFLEEIAAARRRRVGEAQDREPLAALRARCARTAPAADALARLASWPVGRRAVVAEIKRRSPSKGPLAPHLDAPALARAYEANGAFAISVLTEPDYFGGSVADLEAVRAAVKVPLLYKDFVSDPYQVWEARAAGADLVLLIVALLGERTAEFVTLARDAGVEPLVEIHEASELDTALAAGARLVGINNRDLKSFRVDLAVSRALLPRLPEGVFGVAESGLRGPGDLEDLERSGARAFLVGESLVTADDPGAALATLVRRAAP